MTKISTILYEYTKEEVTRLPEGFQIIELDVTNGHIALFAVTKGAEPRAGKNYTYLSVKEPNGGFFGCRSSSKLLKARKKGAVYET